MAPVATFMQAFADMGVPISVGEARAPMGTPKWHQILAITRDESVAERFGGDPRQEARR